MRRYRTVGFTKRSGCQNPMTWASHEHGLICSYCKVFLFFFWLQKVKLALLKGISKYWSYTRSQENISVVWFYIFGCSLVMWTFFGQSCAVSTNQMSTQTQAFESDLPWQTYRAHTVHFTYRYHIYTNTFMHSGQTDTCITIRIALTQKVNLLLIEGQIDLCI